MDVLQLPIVGPLLRWRHIRPLLQLMLLTVAVAVVLHGFLGPQIGPRNLATVLTSIHWRGLLIVGLMIAGNLFCTACPMILVRDAGRRFVTPRFSWPRAWRRKWIGLTLLVLVIFSYELFGLWERPIATASIIIGYFVVALTIDLLFKGAAFCKHVCPIGQFNFVASTMAPTELQIKDGGTCRACRTSDCIKGTRAPQQPLQVVRRGCELGLFLPAKVGNLDCTLCLDCVHACPHDNIALVTRVPAMELLHEGRRSGIGRLAQRSDITALAVVFTFASLVNAFVMTSPAVRLELALGRLLHTGSEAVLLALLFAIALVAAPAILLIGASVLTRALAGDAAASLPATARRYAVALVPFGAGVWLAHYGFHLFTGALTIIPVSQSAVIDLLGRAVLGEPAWRWAGLAPGSVYPLQLGFVLLGTFGSIGLLHGVSLRDYPHRAGIASAPWLIAIVVLAATALWIFHQPMDMRGVTGLG